MTRADLLGLGLVIAAVALVALGSREKRREAPVAMGGEPPSPPPRAMVLPDQIPE